MRNLFMLFLLVFLFGQQLLWGQNPTLFNQADTLYISQGATVHVFGNVVTFGSGSHLEHNGLIQTYNDQQNGDFELQQGGNVHSTGDYKIENDWINNGVLKIDTGLAEMYGAGQWFKGDSVSSFYNLLLTGTLKKEQAQDIRVQNMLDLTDRELAVHGKTLYLDNSLNTAIHFDSTFNAEGIISTDQDGTIRKVVLSGEENRIPTGSSRYFFSHRPVLATLNSGFSSDTLMLTFHQHSPDSVQAYEDDLDSLCRIQNSYFYTVHPADPASHYKLGFATYPPIDGDYSDLASWGNPAWKPIIGANAVQETDYLILYASDEYDFMQEHYAPGHRIPIAPYLILDTTECNVASVASVETPLGMPWYQWTVQNEDLSATIVSGQGNQMIDINWGNNIGGSVSVAYQDATGCWSYPDDATVYDVSVQAGISSWNANSQGFDTEFTFTNLSSEQADHFEWGMPQEVIETTDHSPLTYTFTTDGQEMEALVYLVAEDTKYGCLDTAWLHITVPAIFVVYAPNAFTPDGDGINDLFYIEASNILSLDLQIYNRWGEVVFSGSTQENNATSVFWDGTYRGELVQSGTYTYVTQIVPLNYDAASTSKFEFTGFVNVLR